jgi:hypothetical protein
MTANLRRRSYLVRQANRNIARIALKMDADPTLLWEFGCECELPECVASVRMSLPAIDRWLELEPGAIVNPLHWRGVERRDGERRHQERRQAQRPFVGEDRRRGDRRHRRRRAIS